MPDVAAMSKAEKAEDVIPPLLRGLHPLLLYKGTGQMFLGLTGSPAPSINPLQT